MRFFLLLAFGAVLVWAGTPPADSTAPEDPEVLRARLEIQRLRALVDAGAVPRTQLQQAEDALADARDSAVLRRLMSNNDITEDQAGEMVAAAQRRLDRRQQQLDRTRSLADSGMVARNDLAPLAAQVEFARRQYDLAVSRAQLCHDLAELVRAEQMHRTPPASGETAVRYDGSGVFTPAELQQIEADFQRRFDRPLPISALGQTAVHRAMGFDHRGRVDVALNPDQPEGVWLRRYLESRGIPYFAFWHATAGKATGAHIHIGPESLRSAF